MEFSSIGLCLCSAPEIPSVSIFTGSPSFLSHPAARSSSLPQREFLSFSLRFFFHWIGRFPFFAGARFSSSGSLSSVGACVFIGEVWGLISRFFVVVVVWDQVIVKNENRRYSEHHGLCLPRIPLQHQYPVIRRRIFSGTILKVHSREMVVDKSLEAEHAPMKKKKAEEELEKRFPLPFQTFLGHNFLL